MTQLSLPVAGVAFRGRPERGELLHAQPHGKRSVAWMAVEHGCLAHYSDATSDVMYRVVVQRRRDLFTGEPGSFLGTFDTYQEAMDWYQRLLGGKP